MAHQRTVGGAVLVGQAPHMQPRALWTSLVIVGGCAVEPLDSTSDALTDLFIDVTHDPAGTANTASPFPIDLTPNNPFFEVFGTNGRRCGTCHTEKTGWTITPESARSRPDHDPLFVFDGSD